MRLLPSAVLASALSLAAQTANSATYSYTGNFTSDDEVRFFDFDVTAETEITFRTYSYAGGTMADGTGVTAGGFDPVLGVYDKSDGNLIAYNDDGPSIFIEADRDTDTAYDSYFTWELSPGQYRLSLSQHSNAPVQNLSTAFAREGDEDFTSEFGCSNSLFCDADGQNRTNAWALDILGVADDFASDAPTAPPVVSSMPLPAGAPLMLAGIGALALLRRKA